jgi:hypothetical protein
MYAESSKTVAPTILGLVTVGIGVALALVALFLPKLEVDTHLQSTGFNYGDLGTVAPLTVNSMLQTGSGALIILCILLGIIGFWHHYVSGNRTWVPLPAGAGLIAIAIYQSTGTASMSRRTSTPTGGSPRVRQVSASTWSPLQERCYSSAGYCAPGCRRQCERSAAVQLVASTPPRPRRAAHPRAHDLPQRATTGTLCGGRG